MHQWIYNSLAIIVALISLWALFQKTIRTSETWRTTVTPLASIIGSGFLVSAPLLLFIAGIWGVLAMVCIASVAYGVGSSIRHNIQYIEPRLNYRSTSRLIIGIDTLSRPILGIAYLISVTFYLKLLSAFALRDIGVMSIFWENSLTTGILLFVGIMGQLKGLTMLELLETYSVNTKLAIIFSLMATFFLFNIERLAVGNWHVVSYLHEPIWENIRKILGMLIIVQGFETSRYLGEAHGRSLRIKTMKYAQWISSVIYIVFVSLSAVVFQHIDTVTETTVIDLSRIVAPILPLLLIIAAVMSQFSAAVSDTLGGGGLFEEAFRHKVSSNVCYLVIAILGIGLTWLLNIFEIISVASKAFAVYYLLQIILSLISIKKTQQCVQYAGGRFFLYVALAIIMLMVIVFGTPVA